MSNTELDDNIVPELGVASTGGPRLDADPVDDSFMAEFDKLDDDAAAAEPTEQTPESDPIDDTNFLTDGLTDTKPVVEEPVQDPVTEVADPVQQTPTEPETELDPEIAAIEPPRNVSEESQNNFKKLREIASRYKQEALEVQQLRERLEGMQQNPAPTPSDYEDLKKFKQIFDLKNDPELKTKYDTPISEAKESIYSILKKNGASEETIASIDKAGGPDKVSGSWWKQNVLDKLELLDSKKVEQNLLKVADLREQQENEYKELATPGEEILEERKTEKTKWFENENQTAYKEVEQITQNIPWARFKDVPATATPEQAAEIQKHNASVQNLRGKFDSALWPQTAADRARVAAAAVLSERLVEQLKIEQAQRIEISNRLQQIESENNKLKQAGRAPKPSANVTSSKHNAPTSDRWKLNAGDAIDMGLDEAGA